MSSQKQNGRVLVWLIAAAAILALGIVMYGLYRASETKNDSQTSVATSPTDNVTSNDKFKTEYTNVTERHQFVYASGSEVMEVLKSGSGLVFLGFPACPWCQQLAPRVEDAAREEGLERVHYFDIREARANNDETYQQLVDYLEPYLSKDEAGNPRIGAPDVTAVKDGKVVGRFEHEDVPSGTTPAQYWSDERAANSITQLREMIRATK